VVFEHSANDKISNDSEPRVSNCVGRFCAQEIVYPKTKQLVTWNSGWVEKLR
jgi:hypothetical protein